MKSFSLTPLKGTQIDEQYCASAGGRGDGGGEMGGENPSPWGGGGSHEDDFCLLSIMTSWRDVISSANCSFLLVAVVSAIACSTFYLFISGISS